MSLDRRGPRQTPATFRIGSREEPRRRGRSIERRNLARMSSAMLVLARKASCRGSWVLALLVGFAAVGQGQQQPNVAAQREAMKKLEFLAGKWSGDTSVVRGPGPPIRLVQTEDVQYKMDGLVMLVEGTGRNGDG